MYMNLHMGPRPTRESKMPDTPHPRGGLTAAAFAVGLALSTSAWAGATDFPGWSVSGFGTLGAVHSSEREADFTNSSMKASGAGYSRAWSPAVDSRLGAQLDLALDRQWSAVLQVVSEQHLDSRYKPRIEWANVKYQVTPELALRAGRIALPVFLAADYRKVGYAYPWVRPPVEVYGAIPLPSSDGADLTWRWGSGAIRHTTQAFYGHTSMGLTVNTRLDARGMTGFSQTAEAGALTARLSVLTADLTLNIGQPLFDALGSYDPHGGELADRYEVVHKRASLVSLGLSYDPGSWFVTGEAGHTHTDSYLGKTTALYAGAGVRHGAFTPYAGFARVRAESPTSDPGLPVAGLAPGRAAAAMTLNSGLNQLLQTVPDQSTLSAGVRWDFRQNVALKAQFDRVRLREGSNGTLINTQPDFESGHALKVASVTLDFVF
jgi:hypothetical protein